MRLLRRAPVVLMYHGFAERRRADDPENLFVAVDQLARQLDALRDRGWVALGLDDYLAGLDGAPLPPRSFLLTVDDGFVSVRDLAAPVLRERGVPATLFVPTGLVDRTATWLPEPPHEPLLDAGSLRALDGDGVGVAVHGVDHRDLRGLDPAELDRQVAGSKRELEALLGHPVTAFAYPYGAHDAAARDAVRGAGYAVGFSVFDGPDRFAVPRVDVNATDTLASLRIKLLPAYRTWWRLLQRAGWVRRVVRRVATRGA